MLFLNGTDRWVFILFIFMLQVGCSVAERFISGGQNDRFLKWSALYLFYMGLLFPMAS